MSTFELGSLEHERGKFMAATGFATYTDVNDRLLHTLNAQPITQMDPDAYENYRNRGVACSYPEDAVTDQAAKSLYVTMTHFREPVPFTKGFPQKHGFTKQDEKHAVQHGLYDLGIGNVDFPWHFSAGIANAVADFFVDKRVLTAQQKENFSLHDWASIIEAEWFGRLNNDLALTARHFYRMFGHDLKDYQKGALQDHVQKELGPKKQWFKELGPPEELFQLALVPSEHSEEATSTVKLDKTFNHTLRERMHLSEEVLGEQSAGCPVARKVVSFSTEAAESDPHIKSLVERGTLRRLDRPSTERVFFQQDNTTIDRTLGLIATQMRNYEVMYGTPRLVDRRDRIWPHIVHQAI